ncbi:FAP100, partial [Symbiodinium sp. KB8]
MKRSAVCERLVEALVCSPCNSVEHCLWHVQERVAEQKKKIWDKTSGSRGPGLVLRGPASPKKGDTQDGDALMSDATAALAKERRTEKENMSEFISKKREMFLVQMALDTKKEEIRKLEKKARLKEEALKKSEAMLEEDAIRFDAFLKENDRLAHEALTNAEAQSKAKAEKVQEIKKLKHAISILQTEKAKCQEQLDDNEKYKEFLERLTPPEWFEEQQQVKAKRQEERRKQRHARKLAKWNAMKEAAEQEQQAIEEEERKKALK